jgi:arabinogalactan endo-1,4-beta-galactosidase
MTRALFLFLLAFLLALTACGNDGLLLGTLPGDAGHLADSGVSAQDAAGPDAFILGADITWTQQDEQGGATFHDEDGGAKPILQLLQDHGFNWVRLRTFVDPTQPAPNPEGGTFAPYSTAGFADLIHTGVFGQQIKAAGMGFLLNFHCSDYWADPGKQIKPSAWVGDDLPAMEAHLQAYTHEAIASLISVGARPDMVQIGNSITPGFELSPGAALGSASSWASLGRLLQAGIAGVRAADPSIQIMLHIDRCADAATSIAWIQNALDNGVSFDVFGESCYVVYNGNPGGWPPTFDALAAAFPSLKFVVAEYNADSSDESEIKAANDMLFALPNKQGLGSFFWEPTHSGAWGPGLFTQQNNRYSVIPARIEQFNRMRAAYTP